MSMTRGEEAMKVKFTFWRLLFLFLLAAGLWATIVRYTEGLGASTHPYWAH
jgi:hypothetical protein